MIARIRTGSVLPASWYLKAQRFRSVFQNKMRELFDSVDVILAPTVPFPAIRIGQPTIVVGGMELPARQYRSFHTTALFYRDWPIISVPVFEHGQLPLGVQIFAPPSNEAAVLRVGCPPRGRGHLPCAGRRTLGAPWRGWTSRKSSVATGHEDERATFTINVRLIGASSAVCESG